MPNPISTLLCLKNLIMMALLTILVSALMTTPVVAGDFEDGLRYSFDKNYNNAATSFRNSAESGDANAQFNLALMYEEGRGVMRDYKQAATWYLNAAEQGQALAQLRLAKMLIDGKGIKHDYVEAYKWFSLAKEKNIRGAKISLDRVESLLTKTQISEAQLRKSQWLKSHQII